MPNEIVVVGAGGFGRETLDVIEAINDAASDPVWSVIGVADDSPSALHLNRLEKRGYAHAGTIAAVLTGLDQAFYVVGIGSPEAKRKIAAAFDAAGWRAASLVHPRAVISGSAEIGPGSVVCGGVQLSTNTRLGSHVHLNPAAVIGHDSVLEEFVSINPGAIVSGEVTIQAQSLVGAGAVVLQGLTVGANAIVGASACVTRDVPARATVKGVPAR